MGCAILFTIDDLFTIKVFNDGDGRKPPKYKNEYKKARKNSPFGCPPIYEMEADCFPVLRKHQKQARATLSGRGFLI